MSYYDELVALHGHQLDELAKEYEAYKAGPTQEGYIRCQQMAYSVSDTEWEMKRSFPWQCGSEHVAACKEKQEARYRLITY